MFTLQRCFHLFEKNPFKPACGIDDQLLVQVFFSRPVDFGWPDTLPNEVFNSFFLPVSNIVAVLETNFSGDFS